MAVVGRPGGVPGSPVPRRSRAASARESPRDDGDTRSNRGATVDLRTLQPRLSRLVAHPVGLVPTLRQAPERMPRAACGPPRSGCRSCRPFRRFSGELVLGRMACSGSEEARVGEHLAAGLTVALIRGAVVEGLSAAAQDAAPVRSRGVRSPPGHGGAAAGCEVELAAQHRRPRSRRGVADAAGG